MELYLHIDKFVFDNPIKDNRDNPINKHDVILVSSAISKRLQEAHEMAIGCTKQFNGYWEIHHYNARVLELLKKWEVKEGEVKQ